VDFFLKFKSWQIQKKNFLSLTFPKLKSRSSVNHGRLWKIGSYKEGTIIIEAVRKCGMNINPSSLKIEEFQRLRRLKKMKRNYFLKNKYCNVKKEKEIKGLSFFSWPSLQPSGGNHLASKDNHFRR